MIKGDLVYRVCKRVNSLNACCIPKSLKKVRQLWYCWGSYNSFKRFVLRRPIARKRQDLIADTTNCTSDSTGYIDGCRVSSVLNISTSFAVIEIHMQTTKTENQYTFVPPPLTF